MKPYYVYMLRCADDTVYTGITTDYERREQEHKSARTNSKYTEVHGAKEFVGIWKALDRSGASKLEYRLKRLSKKQKETVISDKSRLNEFLAQKLDLSEYENIK